MDSKNYVKALHHYKKYAGAFRMLVDAGDKKDLKQFAKATYEMTKVSIVLTVSPWSAWVTVKAIGELVFEGESQTFLDLAKAGVVATKEAFAR